MVARIRTGKTIGSLVYYNENKVESKNAIPLGDHNFIVGATILRPEEKISFFKKFTSLNQQTKVNALHISLSFHPSENIDNSKLLAIAHDYMNRIGFSEQPYLIYKHTDTAHPHIHIVSTNIRKDGSRISLHNLGKNESEKARREIEQTYGLKKASDSALKNRSLSIPASAQKAQHGKQGTKEAINNVLSYVLASYKFCSLAELNAVLGLYNINAERGNKNSLIFEKGGLLFFVTDDKGKKISAPLKASRISSDFTLKNIELLFVKNEALRAPYKQQLRVAIDFALYKNTKGLTQLITDLKNQRISILPRINSEAVVYGLTYIDHRSRCVFNGSDLGKAWSAKAVCEKFHTSKGNIESGLVYEKKDSSQQKNVDSAAEVDITKPLNLKMPQLISDPQLSKEQIPFQLKKKRKSKKRKQYKA